MIELLFAVGFSITAPTEREDDTLLTLDEIDSYNLTIYGSGSTLAGEHNIPVDGDVTRWFADLGLKTGYYAGYFTTLDTASNESKRSRAILFKITNPKQPTVECLP